MAVNEPLEEDCRSRDGDGPVVLVVGFVDSVHTARWVNMARGNGLRFVILPVYVCPPSREFRTTKTIATAHDLAEMTDDEVGIFALESVSDYEVASSQSELRYQEWRPAWLGPASLAHPAHLIAAILRLRPVLVHSLVVQFGGYLALAAKKHLGRNFPGWLLSNWGSDIFLFRKIAEHQTRIREILSMIDGYHAECARDFNIARQLGFRGFEFPVLPASGGMDFTGFTPISEFERPSQRREIYIKTYHGWAGRGLHVLSALHLAADALRGFTIRMGLSGPVAKEMAAEIQKIDGLNIIAEKYLPDHRDALMRLSRSRFVAALGIADGISTTLLEAMATGTFPIQANTSCGDEWLEGPPRTGILVSPNDVSGLAAAIRAAATDDEMVDRAAIINRRVVEKRWNVRTNAPIVASNYQKLLLRVSEHRQSRQIEGETPAIHA